MKRTGIVKKIQAALIMLACPFAAFASQDGGEDYHPFVVEGKIWYCTETIVFGNSYKLDYMISGDTIINGYACKKLRSRRERGRKDFNWYFECGLMEQEKKVFKVFPDYIKILYDFGMDVGDSFETGDYNVSVVSIDTLVIPDGKKYRNATIKITSHEFDYTSVKGAYPPRYNWIERIGSLYEPFYCYDELHFRSFSDGGSHTFVIKCIENGEILYDSGEANGVPSATAEDRQDAPVFDLYGRRLNGVPQRGIYIRDGRKYVVK